MSTHNWGSPALAFFMHQLRCFLNIRWASIQTTSHHVVSLLNPMIMSPTSIVVLSFFQSCILLSLVCVKRAVSIFAVSNWRSCQHAQWMLLAAQVSSFMTTRITSFPVTIYSISSIQESPLSRWIDSSSHIISPAVFIAKRIGDTVQPRGTPASNAQLCDTLPSIAISTALSERKLSIHFMRSPSICLAFIVQINLPLSTLGHAALICIRSMPVMMLSFHAEYALSTMMAAASLAKLVFLIPNWPSHSCALLLHSSDCSSTTTSSKIFLVQRSADIISYDFRFSRSLFACFIITEVVMRILTVGWCPISTAPFIHPTMVIHFYFPSGRMAPSDNLSRPGTFLSGCKNEACLTDCSIICLLAWTGGGGL